MRRRAAEPGSLRGFLQRSRVCAASLRAAARPEHLESKLFKQALGTDPGSSALDSAASEWWFCGHDQRRPPVPSLVVHLL